MEYIRLENTELDVSRIAIGGDPMGLYAWGNTHEEELVKAVQVGIENGINFFDTADVYGLGTAEKILAKGIGNRRHDVVIATKFGVRRTGDNKKSYYDISPDWMRIAIEGSLRRLNTDYVDIYQIHYLDHITPIELVIDELEQMKKEGKIRYYGLSNIKIENLELLKPFAGNFCSFQNQYSLACRNFEKDIIKLSKELKATPLTWGSLGQGILTGKYGRDVIMAENDKRSRAVFKNFHGKKLQKNLDIVDELRRIGSENNKEPAAVALRFIMDYLGGSVAIVGVKRTSQVLSNCNAMGWKLSDKEIKSLKQISS